MSFTHLHVHSYFSFLDGAAPPDELAQAVRAAGMDAVAVCDHNSLAGAVRFFRAAREADIKPIIGVEFDIEPVAPRGERSGQTTSARRGRSPAAAHTRAGHRAVPDHTTHLVLLAEDNEGYANLCRLVTAARLGAARGESAFSEKYAEVDRDHPVLSQEHLRQHSSHLIALSGCQRCSEPAQLLAQGRYREAQAVAAYYRELFGPDNYFLELHNHLLPRPASAMRYLLADLAARVGLRCVATNNVHYIHKSSYRLQDVLVCIGNRKTVEEPQPERKPNAEFYLKTPRQMSRLFSDQPEALASTIEIAGRCNWELDLDSFHFPAFDLKGLGGGRGRGTVTDARGRKSQAPEHDYPRPEPGEDTRSYLRRLCELGARRRYGRITPAVRARLEHELRIIEDKGLCDYFLIVWDLVRFARERGIPCSGRGSAGDSLVAYVLGITGADPIAYDLLFERFLNPERRNMPDIDVDFCSRRRDEVTQYIYDKYGAERVAAVCTVNTFRARSALREVGKALNFPEEELGQLASVFPHIRAADIRQALEQFPEVRDARLHLADKRLLIELCAELSGFPRHLSVHVGGLIIGAQPLTGLVPLELANKGIVIAQFDKDDIEALGLVKMDILGLRIHTAIADALDHIEQRTGRRPDLERLPLNDAAAYRLLRSTKTVGLFQLESPGQRNLLGRTQPTEFEDIIANISLFRPGPVQSDMITPYIRRKHGREPVRYPHPDLAPILASTFGVVIYQEQVLRIAHAIAGMSLGEADGLRRMMTHGISPQKLEELRARFLAGAQARGVAPEVAEEVFDMIKGFAAYGFNKAHAACFGKIAYWTAWLKAHFPAEFLAGILSSEPMGFYPPRTIAEEAKRLGVGILPPCVNRSEERCTVEYTRDTARDAGNRETLAIRLGLGLVRGLQGGGAAAIVRARTAGGPFTSLADFCARTRLPRPAVENLILVRAFDCIGLEVQELLWRLGALPDDVVADDRGRCCPPTLDYERADELVAQLPDLDPLTEVGRVALDLHILGVSTTVNPFKFWRQRMEQMGVISSRELYRKRDGDRVRVAGIVVARARPPTRTGATAIFISLEDELGLVDVAVFEDTYQRCGRELYTSPVLCVEGRLTRLGKLDLSVTAHKVIGMGHWHDFALGPRDVTLGSAAGRRAFNTAQAGEKRQTAVG